MEIIDFACRQGCYWSVFRVMLPPMSPSCQNGAPACLSARRLLGWGLAWVMGWCGIQLPASAATIPGLSAPEAVAAYFNGKFPASINTISNAPSTLTLSTLFSNLANLTPNTGLMPYGLGNPPWADGALSRRWIALPNDGIVNTAAEKLTNSTDADWVFPRGTVIVKHFDLPINDLQPAVTKKVETQILVYGSNSAWYGLTYRWRDDETEADLLTATIAVNRIFSIPTSTTTTRNQTWTYQPRSQCFTCHSSAVGTILGWHTAQLNGNLLYPKSGRTANQLWTLSSLGFLNTPLTEATIANLPKTVAVNDFTQTLEKRARSYLDANCAYCHRPGLSLFDLRFSTVVGAQGIINAPTVTDYGIAGQGLIRPRSVSTSMIHYRTNLLGANQMPPQGRTRSDVAGQLTLAEWINSLAGYEQQGPSGLQGRYFNDHNFASLRTTRTDANVDFDWGTASPAPNTNADGFAVIWDGKIQSPGTGTYTFTTDSDDGIRLWVNNNGLFATPIVSNPTRVSRSGAVNLVAGQLYDFHVEYFDSLGDALCHISWSGPGASGIVPASRFFRYSNTALPGPPTAVNDTATLLRGTSTTITVTANDTDTEGDLATSTVSIYSQPSKGAAVKNASGTITYTSNYALGGGADQLLYTVNDATGKTSNRAAVLLTLQTDYGNWKNLYFTTIEQNYAAVSGWGEDPDGDGQSNLLEYAANTDPRSATSSSKPIQSRPSANVLQLRYPKRPGADITYAVETASAPSGAWLSPDPSVTIFENTADHLTIRLPLNPGKKFVRLRCELVP